MAAFQVGLFEPALPLSHLNLCFIEKSLCYGLFLLAKFFTLFATTTHPCTHTNAHTHAHKHTPTLKLSHESTHTNTQTYWISRTHPRTLARTQPHIYIFHLQHSFTPFHIFSSDTSHSLSFPTLPLYPILTHLLSSFNTHTRTHTQAISLCDLLTSLYHSENYNYLDHVVKSVRTPNAIAQAISSNQTHLLLSSSSKPS